MTNKEMSEIFSVLLLAYPNAEVFKGGPEKLAPTIKLWTASMPEVDYWTGQQAAMLLVRENKFPPTIAEFREKAKAVRDKMQYRCTSEWVRLLNNLRTGLLPETLFDMLPEGNAMRSTITAMGGPDKLIVEHEDGTRYYNFDGFSTAYLRILKQTGEKEFRQCGGKLESGGRKQIEAGGKK